MQELHLAGRIGLSSSDHQHAYDPTDESPKVQPEKQPETKPGNKDIDIADIKTDVDYIAEKILRRLETL
jgi:hypothetical protein